MEPAERRLLTAAPVRTVITALLLTLAIGAMAAEPPADAEQASARLRAVLQEIEAVQRRLEDSRTEQREEQGKLRELDLEIQQAHAELRALGVRREERQQALAELEDQRQAYLDSLDQRMAQLGDQLRSAYRNGRQSRIKLVLNQDEPARLGRLLAYYDFINRAQAERISLLREALSQLDAMQRSIDAELAQLAELVHRQQDLLDRLAERRGTRETLLAELGRRIGSEESRLRQLERNRRELEALIERLSDVLADIPADLGNRLGVAAQRGRLPMPLAGPVRRAFGQQRAGGLNSQGWLIGAAAGSEVRAVAYGRVAFADWLRGYGLLMIIDHGDGFMSLYGNNESLLHEAGAWVEPGEPISLVGSNPGSDQGLYFELRRAGKALDPAGWLKR